MTNQSNTETDAEFVERIDNMLRDWAEPEDNIARIPYREFAEKLAALYPRRAVAPAPAGDVDQRVSDALRAEMTDPEWSFERLARAALSAMPSGRQKAEGTNWEEEAKGWAENANFARGKWNEFEYKWQQAEAKLASGHQRCEACGCAHNDDGSCPSPEAELDRCRAVENARQRGLLEAAEVAESMVIECPKGSEWGLMSYAERKAFYDAQDQSNRSCNAIAAAIRTAAAQLGEPQQNAEASPPDDEWLPIASAPKDQVVQLWHILHKVPIACRWNEREFPYQGRVLHWIEATYAHSWPEEAFSHWRPLPPAPSVPR